VRFDSFEPFHEKSSALFPGPGWGSIPVLKSLRLLLVAVGLALVALAVWRWRARGTARWVAVDEGEVAAAWQCLFTRDVELGQLDNGQQVRRLLEAAHDGQKDGYPQHLIADCLPRLEQARRALGQPGAAAVTRYAQALASLEAAVRLYADRLTRMPPVEELDEDIVSHAHSWYSDDGAQARHAGYERFLTCAVPELQSLADDRALYEVLADRCFKHDPVPFMARVRAQCGPLLEQAKPSPTLATSRRKFHHGEDSLQIQSWESCSDLAREQQRLADAREVVAAADAYLAARPRH
jgi:hypothetical protein